jgi:leader peptidase (prepilin peptidase)/N-methyltransferase
MARCFIEATCVHYAHLINPDQVSLLGMWAGLALSALIPALHPQEPSGLLLGGFMAGLLVLVCLGLTLIYPLVCRHLMEGQDPREDRWVKIIVACALLAAAVINLNMDRWPSGIAPFLLSFSSSLSGFMVGGGIIYAMGLFGDMVFRKESMGGGDVKLMAMVGAFMGWKLALLAFFIAPFFGAVYGIVEKIRTKDSAIAYGPFLVLGALVSLFWGEGIIVWIFNGGLYGF